MSRAISPPSPDRRPGRGLLPAIGLALLAHAWLLMAGSEREAPALHSAPVLLSLREAPRPSSTPGARRPPSPWPAPRPSPRSPAPPPAPPPVSPPRLAADAVPAPSPPALLPAPPQAGPAAEAPSPADALPDDALPDDALPDDAPALAAQDLAALPPVGEGVWHYRLRQAGEEGQAWLHWRSESEGYALLLRRRLPSRALPGWRSEGRRDALGLAPLRFAVLRGPREMQALNFRREQGLISYSASTELQPLAPATQDRLSWWLQLPALLQAWQVQHGSPLPGQRFEIPVALIRGGLDRWTFRVLAHEDGLWHLQRGGLGPHDRRLDVWLDPARQYLPVRLHQLVGEEGGWEMELMDDLADSASVAPA